MDLLEHPRHPRYIFTVNKGSNRIPDKIIVSGIDEMDLQRVLS